MSDDAENERPDPAYRRMKDLPKDLLPREKLLREGRRSLSDEELLAIFLRTGVPGCNVLDLAAHIKRCAGGSLAQLAAMEPMEICELSQSQGLGAAKAATLAAVFELGRRAVQERMEFIKCNSARTVYDLLACELQREQQEHLYVLLLDCHNFIRRRVDVCSGTLTRLISHPRDVFAPAVSARAASIVVLHNHPSGDPTPSRQDRDLTTALAKAGEILHIPVMDHIVIGREGSPTGLPYYSFRENGYLPLP